MRFLSLSVLAASLFATSLVGAAAQASELDSEAKVTNEQVALAKDLPATLVIRKNEATGEVQVMHSAAKLEASPATLAEVANGNFVKADAAQAATGELDQDSSRSSWYYCWNYGYNYPQYNYYGYSYNYNYYYGYNYSGWNYSYYRWNYGWGY